MVLVLLLLVATVLVTVWGRQRLNRPDPVAPDLLRAGGGAPAGPHAAGRSAANLSTWTYAGGA